MSFQHWPSFMHVEVFLVLHSLSNIGFYLDILNIMLWDSRLCSIPMVNFDIIVIASNQPGKIKAVFYTPPLFGSACSISPVFQAFACCMEVFLYLPPSGHSKTWVVAYFQLSNFLVHVYVWFHLLTS